MREPERIDRILRKIRFIWNKHPDMRFGQLFQNLISIYFKERQELPTNIFLRYYYLEDSDFEEFLDNFKGFV